MHDSRDQAMPTTTSSSPGSSHPAMHHVPAGSLTHSDVERVLVQHGHRLTSPRSVVVDAVLAHVRPFTAEQLVAELADDQTSRGIGRATIYRTLEILASVDVLTRLIGSDGRPAYICDSLGHRHHLMCSSCGRAVAFTTCPIDDVVRNLAQETDFTIHDHMLEVFGTCPACRARTAT